ncbi:hypothetical protein NP233_g5026 [Leucocoprinus birnbaumii]|uniref:Uncharacterized protein n=1 Tax=Leucocoprinus birnbaumii TaxID=56174 RepID=A0AAD5VVY1_9AGAR|nr:hypothetical protein NP233_g5026 [Leucocoprinus birnbaumii]
MTPGHQCIKAGTLKAIQFRLRFSPLFSFHFQPQLPLTTMTTGLSSTQAIAGTAEMLGGMKINPDALEWANDVPVARAVMNAVAEQLDVGNAPLDASPNEETRAALKEIALEDQELHLLKGVSGIPSRSSPTLAGYKLPSELGSEMNWIQLETTYLEQEAELLRLRTQRIIKASRSMSHDVRSFQDTYATVRSLNEGATGKLDDLSMQMDGTLVDVVEAGYSLLSSFDPLAPHSCAPSFQHITEAYSSYCQSYVSQARAAESAWMSSLTEASIDAEELEDLLSRYGPDVKMENIPSSIRDFYKQEAYLAQIDTLCDQMDGVNVSVPDVAPNARLPNSNVPVISEASLALDPRTEIEEAVARDQCAYVTAYGTFLDNAISVMEDSIMVPLDHLLSNLSLEEKLAQDARVLCGVLQEEVQGGLRMVSSTPSTPSISEVHTPIQLPEEPKDIGAQGWEDELETRLRQYGPGETLLSQSLSAFNAGNNAILDSIYANSPLNTSAPFAYSPRFNDLFDEAKNVATKLTAETERLSKVGRQGWTRFEKNPT